MYFLVESHLIIEEADWKQLKKNSQFQLSATREILRHTFECIHLKPELQEDINNFAQTNIIAPHVRRLQKGTNIQRADLQVQKLNINDEATKEGGINRPNKVFGCPK